MGSLVFSSSYSMSGHAYATYNVRVGFSENYNVSTNQTTISVTSVELQKEGNGTNWGSLPFFGAIKVNGTTLMSMNGGSSVRVSLDGSGYCSVNIPGSGSIAVTHEADGSKSVTFSVDSSLYCEGYYVCGADNGGKAFGARAQSQTVALTSHPRSSSITSYSSSVNTLGTFSLSVARNSPSFYHTARIWIGDSYIAGSDPFATTWSWTVPRSVFMLSTTATSLNARVIVQAYTDSSCTTAVGDPETAHFTIHADPGMKPSVSNGWVSLAVYNTGAVSGLTAYIKGYSRAQATFNSAYVDMDATVLASIASYSVTCQGTKVSSGPYRTPVLNSTSATVVCTVTDTRGRSASESFTLSVVDYAKPALSGVEVFRCDNSGNPDENGTGYYAKASLTYSPLTYGGSDHNSCTFTAAHVASGGSTYTTDGTLTSGAASYPLGIISADASYIVRISAADSLGNTAVYYVSIPTKKWAMKFRSDGGGVAFGKAAEYDKTFEVTSDWDVKFGKPLPISSGGTGAATAAAARTNLGIDFVVDTFTTSQMSLPQNGTASVSKSIAKTGYTPLGIVQITGSGTSGVNLMEFYLSGTTAYLWCNNNTSTAKYPTYQVTVLYKKS